MKLIATILRSKKIVIGPTITVESILIAKVSVRYHILLFMSKR